jgi:hypothetical protein
VAESSAPAGRSALLRQCWSSAPTSLFWKGNDGQQQQRRVATWRPGGAAAVGGKVDRWGCQISYFHEFLDCIKSLKKKKINHTSRIPKLGNFLVEVEGIKMNNFSHCLDFKFGIEFELKFLEPNQF